MPAVLRYPGDRTKGFPVVLGGRWLVMDTRYDEAKDQTVVTVRPLVDPLKLIEGGQE